MIVYRVADGKAWSSRTRAEVSQFTASTVQFERKAATSMSHTGTAHGTLSKMEIIDGVDSDIDVERNMHVESREPNYQEA